MVYRPNSAKQKVLTTNTSTHHTHEIRNLKSLKRKQLVIQLYDNPSSQATWSPFIWCLNILSSWPALTPNKSNPLFVHLKLVCNFLFVWSFRICFPLKCKCHKSSHHICSETLAHSVVGACHLVGVPHTLKEQIKCQIWLGSHGAELHKQAQLS